MENNVNNALNKFNGVDIEEEKRKKLEDAKPKKVFLDEREGLIERVDKILVDKKGRQLLREQY